MIHFDEDEEASVSLRLFVSRFIGQSVLSVTALLGNCLVFD